MKDQEDAKTRRERIGARDLFTKANIQEAVGAVERYLADRRPEPGWMVADLCRLALGDTLASVYLGDLDRPGEWLSAIQPLAIKLDLPELHTVTQQLERAVAALPANPEARRWETLPRKRTKRDVRLATPGLCSCQEVK